MRKHRLALALFGVMIVTLGYLVLPDVLINSKQAIAKDAPSSSTSPTEPTSSTSPTTDTSTTSSTSTQNTLTVPDITGDPCGPLGGCHPTTPTTECDASGNCTIVTNTIPGDGDTDDPIYVNDDIYDSTSDQAVAEKLKNNASGICANLLSCQAQVLKQQCDDCENKWKEEDIPLVIYNVRVLIKNTRNNSQYKAIITYDTNKESSTKMFYDTMASAPKMLKLQNNVNKSADNNHTIVVILEPDSNYFFQLVSKTENQEAKSEILSFRTPNYQPDLWDLIMRIVKQKKG